MGKTDYIGINYAGPGSTTNMDPETGIRYGVVPHHELGQSWYDDSKGNYGDPKCPECEGEAEDIVSFQNEHPEVDLDEWRVFSRWDTEEYVCAVCELIFGPESAFPEYPFSFYYDDRYDDGGLLAEQSGDDPDIFVMKSPYFTYAQFCSPCAPGACYLLNWLDGNNAEENNRAYCFGHDWFKEGIAPYPVYDVETGELVNPINPDDKEV